jgi:hypothetical protein
MKLPKFSASAVRSHIEREFYPPFKSRVVDLFRGGHSNECFATHHQSVTMRDQKASRFTAAVNPTDCTPAEDRRVSTPDCSAQLPIGEPAPIGSVTVRDLRAALDTGASEAFTIDCARHTEGLLSDEEIKKKWALDEKEWSNLATNEPLLNAVQAERNRRVLSGEAAREAAQRHYAKAPNVLGDILANKQIAPRHRIEAAKELRQAAFSDTANASGPVERFVINIDLGGDEKLVFEKEIAIARRTPSLPDDGG